MSSRALARDPSLSSLRTPSWPPPAASDSEVTKRWVPHFYTGPDAEAVRAAVEGKDVEMEG